MCAVRLLCDVACAFIVCWHLFVIIVFRVLIQDTTTANENFKDSKSFIIECTRVPVYRQGRSRKLFSEFKFSYIGRTAVKTFARDLVFYI